MKSRIYLGLMIALVAIVGCSKPEQEATQHAESQLEPPAVEAPAIEDPVPTDAAAPADDAQQEADEDPEEEHEHESFLFESQVTDARMGEPIENAEVRTYSYNEEVGSARTGPEGVYALTVEMHDGMLEYIDVIQCVAPDFARVIKEIESLGPFEDGGTLTQDFTLHSGAAVAGVVLERDTQNPLEGVLVGITKASLEEFEDMDDDFLLDTVQTSADGAFKFSSLEAGPYRILADGRATGFAPDADAMLIVNVSESGGPKNLRLGLNRGGRVTGRVTGPDGEPVAEAMVNVEQEDYDDVISMLGDMYRRSSDVDFLETDTDGTFTVQGLVMEKNYAFTAMSEDYASGISPIIRLTRSHPEREVDIQLATGVTVSGTVYRADGSPAVGAYVGVGPPGDTWALHSRHINAVGDSGPDGRFAIEHVLPGEYEISAHWFDPSGRVESESNTSWDSDDAQLVQVSPDTPLTGITIQLQLDEDFSVSGTVRGTLLTSAGAPVSDATVTLEAGKHADHGDMTTVTDNRGSFTFDAVDWGDHTVYARKDGQYAVAHGVDSDSEITLTLGPELKLSGTAYDQNGDPVPNARVEFDSTFDRAVPMMEAIRLLGDEDDPGLTRTDDQGRFEYALSEPGQYSVTVTSPARGKGASATVRLNDTNRTRDVRVELEAGGAYSGIVTDKHNTPISGAQLTLVEHQKVVNMFEMARSQGRANTGIAVSARDGSFTIPNVPPGSYKLTVEHDEYAPSRVYFDMQPRQDSSQNRVVMSDGGCVFGLAQVSLEPRAGVMLTLNGVAGSFHVETDDDGRYELCRIPAGAYNVMLFDPNNSDDFSFDMDFTRKVNVVDGERVEANFVPPADSVKVTGEMRNVPEDATVMLSLLKGFIPSNQAQVEDDGSFTLGLVPPGDYLMQIITITDDMDDFTDPTELMQNIKQKTITNPSGSEYHLEMDYE